MTVPDSPVTWLTGALIVFSSLSFFVYGAAAFTSSYMKNEFKRYGLNRFRILVALLEILGALGLLLGLKWKILLVISSGGLGVLMLLGFLVRLKIRDGLWLSLPSFLYMTMCFYLFTRAID